MKKSLALIALLSVIAFQAQAATETVTGEDATIDKSARTITWPIKYKLGTERYAGTETLNCLFGTVTSRNIGTEGGVAVIDLLSGNAEYSKRLNTAREMCRQAGFGEKF